MFVHPRDTLTIYRSDQHDQTEYYEIRKRNVAMDLPITFEGITNPATVMAIPDTGADVNAISSALARKLGLKVDMSIQTELRIINGTSMLCAGITTATCRFGKSPESDSETLRCTFHVVREMASALIMSRQFLQETQTLTHYRHRLVQSVLSISNLFSIRSLGCTQERVMCTLDGKDVQALADSGSDVDAMSLAYATKSGFIIEPKEEWVMFANRTVKRIQGICTLQLAVGFGAKRLQMHEFSGDEEDSDANLHLGSAHKGSTTSMDATLQPSKIKRPGTFRSVIYTTFPVLEDIEVDVIVGMSSLESLDVYTLHTDCLMIEELKTGSLNQINRISLLGPLEQKLRKISRAWLLRRQPKSITTTRKFLRWRRELY